MKPSIFVLALLVTGAAGPAPAEPLHADSLPSSLSTLAQVSTFAGYDRHVDDSRGGRVGLSGRVLLGAGLGYGLGLDLEVGATGSGAVYELELWPVGVGLRAGAASFVGLSAGLGVGGARGIEPAALQLPVELRGRVQLGSVRAMAWTAARSTPFADDRPLELEAGLGLGWGRQASYWSGASAGSGPYLALAGRRRGDDSALAILFGLELLGAN